MITDTVLKTIAFVHSNNSYIVVITYDRKKFSMKMEQKAYTLVGFNVTTVSEKITWHSVRELAAEGLDHATDNKSCVSVLHSCDSH